MDLFQLIGEALIAIVKHGWSLTAFAIIAAALFRFEPFIRFLLKHMPKNMRRLLKRQEKMDQRIDRIEQKIDLLLQKEGVTWGAEKNAFISSTQRNTARTSGRKSLISYFKALFRVDTAKRYTRQASTTYLREEQKMSTNYKTLIPALIGAIKLILQSFGIDASEITDERVNTIMDAVSAILIIVGIFLPHKKKTTGGASNGTTDDLNVPIESAK